MAEEIKKIKIGIAGLDVMLSGGIPERKQILVVGGPGAGKTLMTFEMLYHCAEAGIPSVFITLEEAPSDVLQNVREAFPTFSDIDTLMERGLLSVRGEEVLSVFLHKREEGYEVVVANMVVQIENIVKATGAKVVCIDSISLMKLALPGEYEYRRTMMELMNVLRHLGVTGLLTAEMKTSERENLVFEQEYFIFDGILALYEAGERAKRALSLEIVKMRGSKHSWTLAPYEITSHGFIVLNAE